MIKKKYRIANFVEVTGDKSKSNKQNEKYFSVNALNQNIVVKENEIMRVESSGNYVHLHTTEHFFPMRQTLTTLLKELSGNFIQIKRGVVVNLKYVLDLNNNEMVLINEDRYTVSEKYIDELNLAWKNYA
ncbi:LytR/AlgR family response regulator transcription factor [Paraphotobacterium marinum]|uniref:LytR/AlgR family response regulator transcription factor n=1 Tax=Paraphotobacterium marinum TaxID=1755811 RepID=UPI0039ED247C